MALSTKVFLMAPLSSSSFQVTAVPARRAHLFQSAGPYVTGDAKPSTNAADERRCSNVVSGH